MPLRISETEHMTASIIDGTALSREIREQLRERAAQLTERKDVNPGLAVVLVGDEIPRRASTFVAQN